ncbi:hypothetical protein GCM10010988_25540 [Cnuibacter physcomitrellae]|uniref:Uncharacterized protein n=1 Tax=Cnuibacter physcomitrellae TaxID=1619308 RepID=A0A1X9LFA0_9MICO|nr:hypothetical protein [Cnuibacter physcomitrellae]ARJ03886.1 hypothetical protein B5808_00525 [Cnuibacter physcomitrellae]GGI39732.1 hypothetical protein GCM10010988_25540 [Cnuibacter physcomitrellae]
MDDQASALLRAVRAAGLLSDPVEDEGVVRGPARLDAAGYDVSVNLDPDPDLEDADDSPVDPASLIAAARAFLALSRERWSDLLGEIVEEVGPVAGRLLTREDLVLAWVAVVPEAYLLSFPVPGDPLAAHVRVQLGADLELDELGVDEDEDEDDEDALEFDSLDALLDELEGKST